VACACHPAMQEVKQDCSPGQPGSGVKQYKIAKAKRTGGVAQGPKFKPQLPYATPCQILCQLVISTLSPTSTLQSSPTVSYQHPEGWPHCLAPALFRVVPLSPFNILQGGTTVLLQPSSGWSQSLSPTLFRVAPLSCSSTLQDGSTVFL
jgi:hypothetical protein